jgi:ABC transporter transmembrane region 2
VHIVLAVYSVYLNQMLQIRWRRWLTRKFLTEWLADRAYYNISLTVDRAAVGTDNPDQRISEDLRDFTPMTLSLTLDLLSNIVSLLQLYRHPVGIVWRGRGVRHPDPRLHGMGRAGLCPLIGSSVSDIAPQRQEWTECLL